ncbi:BglG family transcription antiterminator [Terribacillus saccharophilus]|uniref:BglG family transcription antiterminator n=1 Tax=Terribacillus saccharophilus TaxID=361277 RepID=UPI000BA55DA5|nr:BglG family transcription antiterminator [Terribacillus saccharophilus]PAF17901.1 PTS fructose transporter subunit IIA [Terribacillus saccharophilus]
MLTNRGRAILKHLMSLETPISGRYLANHIQVSIRTIREDVKILNSFIHDHGAIIDSIMGKGYELNIIHEKQFYKYIRSITGDLELQTVPSQPEDRVSFIIKHLLMNEHYVKLDEIADLLFVSKSTVQNDLRIVKESLSKYDIQLKSRPNYGLKLIGNELKMRFCMSEYLFNRKAEGNHYLLSEQFMAEEDLNTVKRILLEKINMHNIPLSDIAFNNLLVHISIAINRIKFNNYVKIFKSDLDDILDKHEYIVAGEIVKDVEYTFDVQFPKEEIAYIAIHLLGTKIVADSNGNKAVKGFIEEEINQLVDYALQQVEQELNLGINEDDELRMALALHLKPAINRFKYGMNIRNPMLDDIKKNYLLSYEAAVIAGKAIEVAIDSKIDENELGYIALHIGAAIEKNKLKKGPSRCLVVCASGLGTAKLIFYKLNNYFGQSLDVIGTTEYYKLNQYDLSDIDFIISSIPIQQKLAVPVIEVNAVLREEDLQKIKRYFLTKKEKPQIHFPENLVFLRENFTSKEEVLEFLNSKLVKNGLVDHTFLDAVYEREKVAPTAYENLVAIPHPISPQSNETFLAVCTLEKAIMWNDKPIQFIGLLCVKKKSMEDLQSLYDILLKIIENRSIVQNLIKAKTYNEFIKLL